MRLSRCIIALIRSLTFEDGVSVLWMVAGLSTKFKLINF